MTREGFIAAAGHSIYYKLIHLEEGWENRSLLIFLHEGLGSTAQWKTFPEILCRETGCAGLLYDRYGYGKSQPLLELRDSGYLERAGAKELPDLLAALELEQQVILVGHSDGGSVALVYAAVHPHRAEAVITEAAHVFLEEVSISGILNTIETYKQGKLKALLEKYHGERTNSMFYGWAHTWTSVKFRHWSLEKHLGKITGPVLAIQGLDDEYGTPEQVHTIVNSAAGHAEAWLIPDCGHTPHLQKRDLVLERMKAFIFEHTDLKPPQ